MELTTTPPAVDKKRLPDNYCLKCGLVHPPLTECTEAQAHNMKAFLLRIGQLDNCRGCQVTIYWVKHLNGKNAPYTEAGLNHFIDCPNREDFERRKK